MHLDGTDKQKLLGTLPLWTETLLKSTIREKLNQSGCHVFTSNDYITERLKQLTEQKINRGCGKSKMKEKTLRQTGNGQSKSFKKRSVLNMGRYSIVNVSIEFTAPQNTHKTQKQLFPNRKHHNNFVKIYF